MSYKYWPLALIHCWSLSLKIQNALSNVSCPKFGISSVMVVCWHKLATSGSPIIKCHIRWGQANVGASFYVAKVKYDFFLWATWSCKPRTINKLKWSIKDEIVNDGQGMMERVFWSFRNELQQCMRANGQLLQGVIFKSLRQ